MSEKGAYARATIPGMASMVAAAQQEQPMQLFSSDLQGNCTLCGKPRGMTTIHYCVLDLTVAPNLYSDDAYSKLRAEFNEYKVCTQVAAERLVEEIKKLERELTKETTIGLELVEIIDRLREENDKLKREKRLNRHV